MTNLDALREIYPYDPQTRTFTIPTRLAGYDDFFNPLDPSPAPARDLTPDLVDYLNQCSTEIPARYALMIQLQIQNEAQSSQREQDCLSSLRTYYQHNVFVVQAQIRRMRGRALKYLLVSFACLAVTIFGESWSAAGFVGNLLHEALLIGGWVFMWEAVTLNFIEMDAHTQEISRFRRLIATTVTFSYNQN
jgi:hypothetical protein